MLCPSCGTENREGRKFCAECGTALALACPACGGDVKMLRDAVKCQRCDRVYPIERGFPMMLLDQDMRNRPEEGASPSVRVDAGAGGVHVGAG